MPLRRTRILEIFVLAAIYIFTARLGQFLAIPPGNVSLIWIPSGIIIAAVLLRGYQIWPGIWLGAFIGNIWAYLDMSSFTNIGPSVLAATFNGTGDSLGAVVGAYLLKRSTGTCIPFSKAAHVVMFFFYGVIVYSLISAIFGVTSLCLVGFVPWEDYQTLWLTWATGDAMGVLILTPILLTYKRWNKFIWPVDKASGLIIYLMLFLLLIYFFITTGIDNEINIPLFIILPMLIWSTFHFHQNITFLFLIAITTITIMITILGYGPFTGKPLNDLIVEVHLFLSSITITIFILSAMVVENSDTNKELEKHKIGLENLIKKRTDELLKTNHSLHQEMNERKLAEEELLRVRKLESVGLLAGGIAHDFNNVLTGLFGNIELAKQKLAPDHAAYGNIQHVDQALDKATSLTHQLLTFAKGGEPILEMINIGQIIRDSIKFSLSGSNVKTMLNLPDELWQIKADKGQISQVITNLVINADQAMPTGGTLTIAAENIRDIDNNLPLHLSGEVVKLSIADNGSGISVENLKLIFDAYFTTKHTGSGLGLATAHSIITKHKGHISVVSELGIGTTFTIYLPADSSIPKATSVTSTDLVETPDCIAGHILVMDDDEMILNLSTEVIETFGCTVDTAVDGKEAIEKYITAQKSGKAFDVVIMDLTIPGGMGGKDAVKELLTLDPEVKVIVSSGYSTDPIMANYRDYGFKGRLVKPFQMDELQRELSSQIAQESSD